MALLFGDSLGASAAGWVMIRGWSTVSSVLPVEQDFRQRINIGSLIGFAKVKKNDNSLHMNRLIFAHTRKLERFTANFFCSDEMQNNLALNSALILN